MIGPYLDVKYIKLWFVVWNKDLSAMKKRFLMLLEVKKSQNNEFFIKQFKKNEILKILNKNDDLKFLPDE